VGYNAPNTSYLELGAESWRNLSRSHQGTPGRVRKSPRPRPIARCCTLEEQPCRVP
jgi:hypothetical protein